MLLVRATAARASHARQIRNYANEEWDPRWPFVRANVRAARESTLHGPRRAVHLLNWINAICAPHSQDALWSQSAAFVDASERVNRRGQCFTCASRPRLSTAQVHPVPSLEQEAAAEGSALHHGRRCHAPCGPRTLKGAAPDVARP